MAILAACEEAPLVLISAGLAQRVPSGEMDKLLCRVTPPVVIVPDVRGQGEIPDLGTRLRRQLGVLE